MPDPEPEFISLIHQILIISMDSKSEKLISLRPQIQVYLDEGFQVDEKDLFTSDSKWCWWCLPFHWRKFSLTGEGVTHFLCQNCNGENHEEYEKASVEIKHPLHQKHSLQLVLLRSYTRTRECYCCDEDLSPVFSSCVACDYAMNIACEEKPRVLSVDHPKWHEHPLALFPRNISLTCDLCALADPSCPYYICPPCDYVVHQSCISLPRVIKISRHLWSWW